MKSITIHNIPSPLASLIQTEADKHGLSLNKTIQMLLEKALAFSTGKKHDFSEFSGVWSKKEFKEFEKAEKDFERVFPEDWK